MRSRKNVIIGGSLLRTVVRNRSLVSLDVHLEIAPLITKTLHFRLWRGSLECVGSSYQRTYDSAISPQLFLYMPLLLKFHDLLADDLLGNRRLLGHNQINRCRRWKSHASKPLYMWHRTYATAR